MSTTILNEINDFREDGIQAELERENEILGEIEATLEKNTQIILNKIEYSLYPQAREDIYADEISTRLFYSNIVTEPLLAYPKQLLYDMFDVDKASDLWENIPNNNDIYFIIEDSEKGSIFVLFRLSFFITLVNNDNLQFRIKEETSGEFMCAIISAHNLNTINKEKEKLKTQ